MKTNKSWADEVEMTEKVVNNNNNNPDEKSEDSLNPVPSEDVKTVTKVEQPEGCYNPESLAVVQSILAEVQRSSLFEKSDAQNNTEVGRQQSPEVVKADELATVKTRHVGSNTEEELASVYDEVG